MLTANLTLSEIAKAAPHAAAIFHNRRLDYCCGGGRTLAEAARTAGIPADQVLAEILAGPPADATPAPRWEERPLGDLIDHIVARYHRPLPGDLQRLESLARKVEDVHRDKPERPAGLADVIAALDAEVMPHMGREEQILFPMVQGGAGRQAQMPIRVMLGEHEVVGRLLGQIRTLTGGLKAPAAACASWTELYRGLERLEAELMEHIHLENNVLFPRVLA